MDATRGPVVVGYDGSRCSEQALAWAVGEAGRRGAVLRVVHAATGVPPGGGVRVVDLVDVAALDALGHRVLVRAEAHVRTAAPGLVVTSALHARGSPSTALVEESAGAQLVVVGSRGRGGFAGLLLGSTSTAVAMRAHCPVVVVHGGGEHPPGGRDGGGRVVVGVDGSDLSEDAVAFAFAAAATRGAELLAVHCWQPPWVACTEGLVYGAGDWALWQEQEELSLAERLAGWAEDHPDVAVTCELVTDDARWTLLQRSRGASLLVVGSHGRGGLSGLLLGSVSQALVHHAPCPVAVVRRSGTGTGEVAGRAQGERR